MIFLDRSDAGRRLARQLVARDLGGDVVVLGLACAGVVVAYEVARELAAALDVLVVRRLYGPRVPRLAVGAVAEGGHVFIDPERVRQLGSDRDAVPEIVAREQRTVEHWALRCRSGSPRAPLEGRRVVIVDDGAAFGHRARAAIESARALGAGSVVVAVPVMASPALEELRRAADEVVYLDEPSVFISVGYWYARCGPVSDEEVSRILERARLERRGWIAAPPGRGSRREEHPDQHA